MPRQMPMTLRPRICAQARGGSILLAFQIGCRGSRRQRPLQDRPPTLQAFRSVLSRTRSVSTHGLHGSRSYLRRHGVQFRGVHIYYHKTAFTVHPKNRWPGGRLNTKAQTPPLLGTDPSKPLILLAQIAICPESRPLLPRLRLPRRNPPPPAASRTPARPSAPFLPQSHLHELEAFSTHFSGVLYMHILSSGVTMP